MSLTRSVMKQRDFATSLAFHSGGPAARMARAAESRCPREAQETEVLTVTRGANLGGPGLGWRSAW